MVKAFTGDAFVVMPLEGLWWAEDMSEFDPADKSNWLWTMMICLPDVVTEAMAEEAIPAVTAKKNLRAGVSGRHHEIYVSDPRKTARREAPHHHPPTIH